MTKLLNSEVDWPQYFMTIAYVVAMKSKDPSTKLGAIIVGEDNEIRSTGYNGIPRGIEDKEVLYTDKSYKYLIENHAEENAILNAARIGVSVKNCTMYVPWFPCVNCARLIIQAGISSIVYHRQFPGNSAECFDHWKKSMKLSRDIITNSSVRLEEYDGAISLPSSILYMGKIWHLD